MENHRRATFENQKLKPKDLAQLSMIQIMILHALSRYSQPLIRHSLLQEINESLKPKGTHITSPEQVFSESLQNMPKTLVSPSSFYTSLEVLEKKGLVLFNRNKKGKVVTVEKTQLTDNFIESIHQYFLFNIVNAKELNDQLYKKITEILDSQHIKKDSVFSIFPFDNLNLDFIEYLAQNYKNFYVFGIEKVKEKLLSFEKFNLSYSKVKNGQIREPDNDFDVSITQIYNQNCNFYDLSLDQILAELVRITKPNGIIFIYALKELGIPDTPFMSEILVRNIFTLYNKSIRNDGKCFTKTQISDVLLKAGLTNLQIIEDEGILIGMGRNK